jgi:D-beta-D-heptose 7-phosphate kinase/D-beta-D-heptose 1-phosphate adenosyltransferase
MDPFDYQARILSWNEMKEEMGKLRAAGKKVVFTNGAFDILHTGHLTYMTFARRQGDCLVVGLNSDASVRRYKGEKRPIVPETERATMLAALRCVDYVVLFDEDEPKALIANLLPDVLVKGEDWAHYVSGRDVVEANGGHVVLAKMVEGRSTTNVIKKVVDAYGAVPSPQGKPSAK